jgi:hypothetical protein
MPIAAGAVHYQRGGLIEQIGAAAPRLYRRTDHQSYEV